MPFHFFIIFGSLYRGGQSERFSYKERHQYFYAFFCLGTVCIMLQYCDILTFLCTRFCMSSVIVYKWKLLVWLNLIVQSGLNISEQHWWPLAGNTTQVLWHMTHYKVSVAITVWKTVTKTQDIFSPLQEL